MTTIPTLAQLYSGILADLQAEYGVSISLVGRVWLRAIAAVQAGKLKLAYLYIARVQKNIWPDTADPEASGGTLERFGRVKIGRDPYPATQGQYTVAVTGTAAATIPAQTTFKSDDTALNPGMLFILDTAYVMPGTSGSITLRALTAGVESKLAIADTLTATAPIIGVASAAAVTAETVAPVAAEDLEDYRRVVLDRFRLYPQGGASADYRIWASDAAGVEKVYPYAASGAPNEVNVFVEATIASSTDGMGTPTSTILTDVENAIEQDPVTSQGRRPLSVFAVNVLPVVINEIEITITGGSISPANQALITAALEQAVNGVRPFIAGSDILATKNDTFSLNNIINEILTAVPGTQFTSVSMTVATGGGPPIVTVSKTYDNGNIPFLTTVNYV